MLFAIVDGSNFFSSFHRIYKFLVRFRNVENLHDRLRGGYFHFSRSFSLTFSISMEPHFIWGPNYIIAFYVKLFNVEYPIIACEVGIFIFLQSFSLIFLYRWILHVRLGFKTTLLPLSYFFSFQFSISDIRLHMSWRKEKK